MALPRLTYEVQPVVEFARQNIPGFAVAEDMRFIGLERDGRVIACVVYYGINAHNCWMHVAGLPGERWLTRANLRAVFEYPFGRCGVARISGYVEASNAAARRYDEHLGFRVEATLKGAARDGGDVLIYVMTKEECQHYVDPQ